MDLLILKNIGYCNTQTLVRVRARVVAEGGGEKDPGLGAKI